MAEGAEMMVEGAKMVAEGIEMIEGAGTTSTSSSLGLASLKE